MIEPGRPWPLGASLTGEGVNFAVFSAHATWLELCLLDPSGAAETARLPFPERTDQVFHGHVPGLAAGQVYGLRAHGPWAPHEGHRFNPAKLLLDPYARALVGEVRWAGPHLVDPDEPFVLDPRDSAPFVPKAVVVPAPPQAGPGPGTKWAETVLYEAHVKGLTALHPDLPEAQRGRFLGLAHPRVIEHLARLGITAVELLPVAAFLDEHRLVRQGLRNYWGYNPYAFMVPEPRYAAGDPRAEFCAMVEALHGAGIEIILDVVFNHTAETDELGPTLSFRGLDNASYYRLRPDDRRLYVNDAGTGNVLNLAHPRVLQLVMDALRFWAGLGVDGFRFDLGLNLGRDGDNVFRPTAAFFQALAQDPALGRLKLLAEPWDIGRDGYALGRLPPPLAEWNDRFRDTVRRFWRGDEAVLPELAGRLLGSADLFEAGGRGPRASLNYVTSHDGFTLADLVAYERKHNEANGEANRDGHHDNLSANWGSEGPSADAAVNALRDRQRRNLLATLLLAQGTPMLQMGDELGRTQAGNNNAYCQDNPSSWCHWDGLGPGGEAFLAFARRLVALRKAQPLLRQPRFLHGRVIDAAARKDVTWLAPDGTEKTPEHWHRPLSRCFGLLLGGPAVADPALLLLLVNAGAGPVAFTLPEPGRGRQWHRLLDTAEPAADPAPAPGAALRLAERSLVALAAGPG
jgi:isoamylase